MKFLKSSQIIALLIFWSFLPNCTFSQKIENRNPKAVALNKKAFRMLISDGASETTSGGEMLTRVQLSKKVLMILDSATSIDPYYKSAYLNKLSSLIRLKRYNDAVGVVDRVLKNSPLDDLSYLKKAVIYKFYLMNALAANIAFNKAYKIATSRAKQKRTVLNEKNVALVLFYQKGTKPARSYLDGLSMHYKTEKSKAELIYLKGLFSDENTRTLTANQLFENYSTN